VSRPDLEIVQKVPKVQEFQRFQRFNPAVGGTRG